MHYPYYLFIYSFILLHLVQGKFYKGLNKSYDKLKHGGLQ